MSCIWLPTFLKMSASTRWLLTSKTPVGMITDLAAAMSLYAMSPCQSTLYCFHLGLSCAFVLSCNSSPCRSVVLKQALPAKGWQEDNFTLCMSHHTVHYTVKTLCLYVSHFHLNQDSGTIRMFFFQIEAKQLPVWNLLLSTGLLCDGY